MNTKSKLNLYFLIVLTTLLTACGGGSSEGDDSANNEPTTEPAIYGNNVVGIAQFGLLKNAKVIIAKIPLGGGRAKKVFEETTTDGNMSKAGRFNTHSSELEDKAYYLYAIQGGEDIDADGNGRENNPAFNNKNTSGKENVTGAIVRGEWLKALGNKAFRITPLSHHILAISTDDIKNYSGLRDKLHATANSYLKQDINGDGKQDMTDILVYNPLKDKAKIQDVFNDLIGRSVSFKQKQLSFYPDLNKYKKIGQLDTVTGYTKAQRSHDNKSFYLSTISAGFHIFDISAPYDMVKKGFIDTDFDDFQISSDNKKVYGVDSTDGLTIIDISNAYAPKEIGKFGGIHSYGYRDIILSNDESKAFAFTGDELHILNITDPSNINKISSIKMSFPDGFSFRLGAIYKSSDDSRIYIGGQFGLSKIETFNVSNPSKPSRLGVVNYHYNLLFPEVYDRFLSSDKEHLFIYQKINGTLGKIISLKR
jgi:hypothetical protein